MSLILSGTDGLSDVDGTAATPAIRGTDTNTGIFFPAADTIAFSEGGVEALRLNSSGQIAASTDGTASVPVFTRSTDTNTGLFFPAADTVAASVGGTEGLRLTSTGLGVGTSTPGQKLDVRGAVGAVYVNSTTGTNQAQLQLNNSGGDFYFALENSAGNNFNTGAAYAGVIWRSGANPICFVNNSTLRATIDSSGNLGIGTSSPGARIQAAGDISSAGGRFRGNTSGTTLADGASTTVDGGFGGLLIIGLGSGSSAHFYCPYSTGTSLIRSDVVGTSFSATDSGTAVRIFKSNNSTTVTIKNSSGGSVVIYVTVYTGF